MKRIVIVYLILIPIMWLLTEMVWGGVHGLIAGIQIGKSMQNPEVSKEITEFMKDHGLDEKASKEQSATWYDTLPEKDKHEFEQLLMNTVYTRQIAGFGSTFAVSIIVFGIVGLSSGIFTKQWYYVGVFPLVSFIINNPLVRFSIITDMPIAEKIIIALVAQFGACYLLAYAGVLIGRKLSKKKNTEIQTNF